LDPERALAEAVRVARQRGDGAFDSAYGGPAQGALDETACALMWRARVG
jgi:hypothetical protein